MPCSCSVKSSRTWPELVLAVIVKERNSSRTTRSRWAKDMVARLKLKGNTFFVADRRASGKSVAHKAFIGPLIPRRTSKSLNHEIVVAFCFFICETNNEDWWLDGRQCAMILHRKVWISVLSLRRFMKRSYTNNIEPRTSLNRLEMNNRNCRKKCASESSIPNSCHNVWQSFFFSSEKIVHRSSNFNRFTAKGQNMCLYRVLVSIESKAKVRM